jgi:uncharacterized membrane protein
MNSFFVKGIELAEQKFAETGDFKEAIAVLEHTCDMCKSNLPCYSCVIDSKKDEFEHPREVKEVAATSEIIIKKRTVITTVIDEEIKIYQVGDIVTPDGHVFHKYHKGNR